MVPSAFQILIRSTSCTRSRSTTLRSKRSTAPASPEARPRGIAGSATECAEDLGGGPGIGGCLLAGRAAAEDPGAEGDQDRGQDADGQELRDRVPDQAQRVLLSRASSGRCFGALRIGRCGVGSGVRCGPRRGRPRRCGGCGP